MVQSFRHHQEIHIMLQPFMCLQVLFIYCIKVSKYPGHFEQNPSLSFHMLGRHWLIKDIWCMATKTTLSFGCFFCTMLEICMSKQTRPKLQISSCYQYTSSGIYKHRHYSNIFLNSLTSISRIAFFRFINLFSKICNQNRPKHPPNAHYSRRPSFRSLKTSMKL